MRVKLNQEKSQLHQLWQPQVRILNVRKVNACNPYLKNIPLCGDYYFVRSTS